MKRLLALLLLAMAPAFAQELPPIYSPTVEQTYTPSTTTTTSLQNVNQTGGTALTLYDDGTTFTPIELPFDFYYFGSLFDSVYISQNGFISFTSNANGCCSGNQLPFLSQESYYNVNNSIFAMWSDLADFNAPGNPYYKFDNNMFTVGWYGVDELGSANKFTFEINLFSDSSFNIVYGDFDYTMATGRFITSGFQGDTSNEFYTIYYGNDPTVLENNTYTFTSSSIVLPPPPPPEFLYWNTVAGENQSFTLTEPGVVRYGAMGSYLYQELQPGTYECSNGAWGGDPIGGVVKSCDLGSNEAPPPPVVNCASNPLDPSCIIDSIIDEEPVMLADTVDQSMPVDEEDPAPEELLAAEESIIEEFLVEESLEELLADESVDEEMADEELVADIKELANEEKAEALSDNISKDVLGAALSVAADAVSAATAAGGESASSSTSSDSSSRSTTLTAAASDAVATTTETIAASETQSEAAKEESVESSALAALDILDTGRQLGQEALAVTLSLTEAAAMDSLSEAESVAAVSSGDSVLASMNSIETAVSVTEEQQTANNETATETITEETSATESTEVLVAESSTESIEQMTVEEVEQKEEVKEEVMVVEVKEQETTEAVKEQEEIVVAEVQQEQTSEVAAEREDTVVAEVQTQQVENATEQREEILVAETVTETMVENVEQAISEVQSEQQSAVEFTTVDQAMELFASNVSVAAAAEQEELENSIVQQAIASSQTNEEENKMGFAEAEAVTIASDPALANAFNVGPNTASLELLGVLGSRAEEKSDAELRAEQVVAANKEQQDAINANYMEADQSGILAAIGSETDVTSYRTAMIRDNNVWYKPEDIYKNIVIKDNVRGSYFLEKGNTDTYKKMVEEQYKDE